MQPQEHRLSQEVLEFLIAHQDWFMLEINPHTVTGAADGEQDATLPSDETNNGDWNLVGDAQTTRLLRRRTTIGDRGSKLATSRFVADLQPLSVSAIHSALTEGLTSDGLSPVAEAPGSPVQSVGGSIRRSRTLPNRRGTVEGRSGEGEVPPTTANSPGHPGPTPEDPPRRVLRKQKRSSMQVQRHSQSQI